MAEDLTRWIDALRERIARGRLDDLEPLDLGDGTRHLPGRVTVLVMLADLDHLNALPPEAREWVDFPDRRRELLDSLRRLRGLIG
jgi:hypothetical protein